VEADEHDLARREYERLIAVLDELKTAHGVPDEA
jgi:hypothetical protein